MAGVEYVSCSDVKDMLSNKEPLTIVDVRQQEERDDVGYLKQSMHIPSHDFQQHMSEVHTQAQQAPVVFHCALSQSRAVKAANAYKQTYPQSDVKIMTGGFQAWAREYKDSDLTA